MLFWIGIGLAIVGLITFFIGINKRMILVFCLGIAVIAGGGWMIYSTALKPLSVEVNRVDTLGTMKGIIEVVPDTYTFEVVPQEGRPDDLLIALTLELKKTWQGAEAADGYSLVPLSKNRIIMEGEQFVVSDPQRFSEFLAGEPDSRMNITFRRDTAGKGDAKFNARNLARTFYGFEARDRRSQSIVVAVSAFRMGREIAARAGAARSAVIAGFQENAVTSRFTFVDTTLTDAIMEQHRFELSDWSSGQKVAEIGRALNANIIVTGEMLAVEGEGFNYTITVLNINTMEVLGTSTGSVETLEAVRDVAAKMNIRLPAGR